MRANHEQNPYFVDLLQNFPTSTHSGNTQKNRKTAKWDWRRFGEDGQNHFVMDCKFVLQDKNCITFLFEYTAASKKLTIESYEKEWPDVKDLRFYRRTLLDDDSFVLKWDNNQEEHCFNKYIFRNGLKTDQYEIYRQNRLNRLYESSIDKWTKQSKESESQEPPHVAMIRDLELYN